ncbi:PadR family transcriptional regulator [Nocardioides seonyuensis]|uniref:PadR family transcriptional regulator n=1 Tax=Nocardioides seonyuensis TaxID=2518371 RepID=A0A4P7II68_9ACTN|nr:PadR family transcriptional regulator [Nocardioides seonyuensis]QBX55561.1 PadR family transcriptional regulator [Nocardioides seonyuensis]
MSIKHGLLALLEREPMYGYQLRSEFDATTGSTWPLNVGQVYTTLARLERDGLVTPGEEDAEGRVRYSITDAGREELAGWFGTPVVNSDRPRDELAIKLALAVTVPGIDVAAVIQQQRASTIVAMQDLTRLKATGEGDLSWSLVLESMRFQYDAEIRWLDHCETSLARAVRERDAATTDTTTGTTTKKAGARR